MSSSRNKRKRPENDPSAMAGASRRRSRDSRASTAVAPDSSNAEISNPENGVGGNNNEKEQQGGEPATKVPTQLPQSSLPNSKSKVDKPGGAINSKTTTTSDTSGSKFAGKNATNKSSSSKAPKDSTISKSAASEETGSSQDESTTPRQPLHLAQDSKTKQHGGNDRSAKIQGLIRHRSILLHRIKLCRSVAERRLGEKDYSFVRAGIGSSSHDVSDDQELAAFRDLTWKSTQIAKKSKSGSSDGVSEKRSSLSLRRGSSVGKRMNAALHSLAPHHHSSTTTDGAPVPAPIKPVSSTATPGKAATKAPPHSNMQKTSSKSAFQAIPPENKKLAPAAIAGRPVPSQVPLSKKATSSSSSILPNTSKQQYLNDAGTTTTKGRPPSSKGLKSSGRQSSVSALPLHTAAGAAPLPRNRLAMQQQQKVHFPLAVGLRAKREMIQSKLNMLLDPRANNNDLPVAPPRGKSSSKKKKNVIPPINPPVQLPPRRKTHWDSVLEEMRWMATDFIEERKWKTSAARTIASSIPGPGVSIVSPRVSRNRRLYADGTATGIDDIDVDKECKMDLSDDSLGASGTKVPSNTTKKVFYPDRSQKAKARVKEYVKPSSEVIKAAKKQGKIISAMIFELGEATSDCGSFKESDELSNKALDRFLDTRSNILHDRTAKADSSKKEGGTDNGGVTLNGDSKGNTVDEKPTAEVESSGTSSSEEVEEVPFEKITEYFDRLAKGPGKTRGKVSVKEMANSMKAEKFQFGGEQKVALEFVDKLWANKPCFGAVLEGPPTSGKTICVCTLLWKHRFKGPQLVVCSPASVLRWRYELGRFEDIRVLTVGLTGGICCPSTSEIIEPEEGDVLVCEYSTVDRALESIEEENLLHSVVIDSRHPAAFFATIGNSEEYDAQKEWYGRTELGTTSWWEKLSTFFNEYETRRLLVQYADKSRDSLVTSANPDREQLEIFSLRFACMIGPKLFLSKSFPLQRRVMLWARQKGKKMIPDKTARVKRVLNDAIHPIVFRMTKSLASTSDIEWNIRLCAMPDIQRKAYDNCCSEVRGALAGNLQAYMEPDSSFRSFRPIVNALSRLRQQCFHSRGVDTISMDMIQNRLGDSHSRSHLHTSHEISCGKLDGVFWRKLKDSPAQPDISLALDLMKNSAKLRELASILVFDCCLSSYVKEEVVSFLREFNKEEESLDSDLFADDDPKKVAVLAVLPEVQILISVFLNAAGIRHDLLHRLPTRQMDLEPGDGIPSLGQSDLGPDHWSALAYSEKQHTLSNFSLDTTEHSEFGCFATTDVIVSSPEHVGSWMCGLSIESAEYIISVDEDWTCSGDFLLANILTRCLGRNGAKGKGPELIQLVCDNTVEKKIYDYRGASEPKTKASYQLKCQLDPTCFMRIPESDDSAVGIYRNGNDLPLAKFTSIPGISLLQLRNKLLSDVLVTAEEIAPRFLSGEKVCFLPEVRIGNKDKTVKGTNADAEKRSETAFLREFLQYERLASIRNPMVYQTSDSSFHLAVMEGPGTEHPRNTGCPQSVVHFPSYLMTRQDLFSLSTLFYFERQSLAFVWKPLAAGAASVSLAQLPCPDGTAEGLPTDGAMVNPATDLADMWAKSGLSRKPDDMATSLLFYGTHADNEAEAGMESNSSLDENVAEKARFNAYAKLYSTSWDGGLMRDGNQGTEALVFFPPLFPKTRACSRIKEGRLRTILSSQQHHQQQQQYPNTSTNFLNHPDGDNLGERKRKESSSLPDDPFAPTPKRLRSEDPTPLPQPADETIPPPPSIDDDLLDNLEGILDDDDDVAPFAPIDPPLGALVPGSDPLMPDPASNLESAEIDGFGPEIKQEPYKEEAMTAEGMELAIMGCDEDFGLLGAGALPTIDDPSYSDASDEPIRNQEIPDILSNPLPCDSEDVYGVQGEWVASTLNSVLLFVKRRPISTPIDTHIKGQPLGMPPPVGNWPGSNVFPYSMGIPGHESIMNGHDTTTKKKKKSASQTGLSALARPPPIDINPMRAMKTVPPPNMMHFPPGKDSQQHRLHASYASRHYATGLSMFESTAYQVALMNVKNRITSNLAVRQQKSGSKPGEADRARAVHEGDTGNISFTGFVQPLKLNCKTGDAAKALASSQRSALRRSLVAPCRVDFGPFSGGYLAVSSGMTGISPPRLRLGVSLPMGVKVSQIREQPQLTWSGADDKLLQDSATRFGMNWMVVARALTGLEATGQIQTSSETGADQTTSTKARSARQCRDRWQALARSRPSLANDIRKSERVLRENALNKPTMSPIADDPPLRAYAPVGQEIEFGKLGMLYSSSRTDNERGSQEHQKTLYPGCPAPMELDAAPQVSAADSSVPPTASLVDGINSAQEQTESTTNGTQQLSTTISKRRGFAAFSAAKGKKQFIPLTVPGVPSGGQPNQPVPSHASHMQSVEASIAAQWSTGRKEMWPLQILDCAEKYRAAVPPARPTPSSGQQQQQQQQRNMTGNSSSSSQAKAAGYSGSSSSSSSRRQASSSSSQRPRSQQPTSSRSQQPTSSSQRGSATSFPAVPPNNTARATTSSTSASGHRASSSSSQPRSSAAKASTPKAATTKASAPNSYAAPKKNDESKGKRKK